MGLPDLRLGGRWVVWLGPGGTFVVALVVAFVLHGTGRLPFNADQAMVGLMANDIRAGIHPVFFQGSEYAGTVEPHLVALAFGLFGSSAAVQRTVVALAFASTAALLSAAAGVWFGRCAAFGAGLYVALGPAYLLHKGLTSDGHYGPVLLIGSACFLQLALLSRQAGSGAGFGLRLFVLGLLHGVGIWISPLSVTYLLPTALLLLRHPVRPALRLHHLALSLSGGLLGSLPWWLRNIETDFASFGIPGARGSEVATLVERGRSLVSEGLPLLLGPAAIASGKAPQVWSLALAACLASFVFLFGASRATSRSQDPVARAGLSASAVLILASIGLALAVRGQDEPPGIRNFQEPRILLPVYVGLAPAVGHAASRAVKRRVLAGGLGAAFAAVHASGWVAMPRWTGLESGEAGEVAVVLEGLRREGVRSIYASYWAAYPITFFSRGQIVGSPFGSNSSVRRDDDRRKVDDDPSPGFLLWPPERDRFDEYLRDGGLPFRRKELGRLTLFAGVGRQALPALRSCRCIPPIVRRDSVSWVTADGPAVVAEGDVAPYFVRFRNAGLSPWPPGVNVGYHWRNAEGRDVERSGLRTGVGPGPDIGHEYGLSVRVSADVPPGVYQLTFDLVIEGITWFEWKGVTPVFAEVEVVARKGGRPGSSLDARPAPGP